MKGELPGGYELDDDRARIDLDEVHRFISEDSYWAAGRPRETMRGLIERADRVVGLFQGDTQVGFSRTVDAPDAGLTYLADVYVLPEHRGKGLGVELVRFSVDEGPFAANRWVLHTKDAHALYARFGFAPGERLLERSRSQP
ncbi:MAG: GNAT family N-acetyltransferase [Gaiellaceae bacterium MAG52_C11]|nr:GNAT family N-acetyltransferase [Candidatus Gaiellasilicea maunaloa]